MTTRLFPDELTLLHNPKCSKSRAAKALLEERDARFRERRYLDDPLSKQELQELEKRLGRPASDWARKGEPAYKETGLSSTSTSEAVLEAMTRFPILIERPILIRGARAVVGRPPERVLDLLD